MAQVPVALLNKIKVSPHTYQRKRTTSGWKSSRIANTKSGEERQGNQLHQMYANVEYKPV